MKVIKRRLFNRPFFLLAALFAGRATVMGATIADKESRQREADLTRSVHRGGTAANRANLLVELGLVRERVGKFTEALATWGILKKQFGPIKINHFPSSDPAYTGAQLADFFSQRIRRKQNRKPVTVSRAAKQRIGFAACEFHPRIDQLDLALQADLDGDGVEEIFFIGSSGPLGKRKQDTMGIAKWIGKSYQTVWKSKGGIPFMVRETDKDGDGWKDIFCGCTPETDDAATLYFNGKSALFF